uniref:Uncharacterized protein n=1 Tax=Heterorhabditis bacteriophora TaxID=37862 RepID=A0A1I7XIW5_HETBA
MGRPLTANNIHGKKVLLCIWWDMKGVLKKTKTSATT